MDATVLEQLSEFICGDNKEFAPVYRSGSEISRFLQRAGISGYVHDGSTRKWWTLNVLNVISEYEINLVISRLASPKEYQGNHKQVNLALKSLNQILSMEGIYIELNGIVPEIKKGSIQFKMEEPNEKELKSLPPPDFFNLEIENNLAELLSNRWEEADKCIKAQAYLSGIIIMGSLLEGLFLTVLQRFPQQANQSTSAPKDRNGNTKKFYDWSLSEMIDVGHSEGWIDLDVKHFSHALRIFRNLIHPYEQMVRQVKPDEDTSNICWLVVQAAVNDLARVLQRR
ncbi:hypothetical protein [Cohnella thailandensis]|uniref:DUF4145 domain-containing protein n=1 Tax=Cohnella thailandensis TaxID=557557 RepID=A0A841SRB9_9BACL|nr:hypothetical protein [Cohnella thailandensis]MBB6632615.1 hypothetical protein [Cohnella thailandensis]MBP1975699.1 hypothetical protein [Cohnella thailandensis]